MRPADGHVENKANIIEDEDEDEEEEEDANEDDNGQEKDGCMKSQVNTFYISLKQVFTLESIMVEM